MTSLNNALETIINDAYDGDVWDERYTRTTSFTGGIQFLADALGVTVVNEDFVKSVRQHLGVESAN